jgi:hypothetical protein
VVRVEKIAPSANCQVGLASFNVTAFQSFRVSGFQGLALPFGRHSFGRRSRRALPLRRGEKKVKVDDFLSFILSLAFRVLYIHPHFVAYRIMRCRTS